MRRLLVGGEVVPEHGRILQVGLRVPFLSVDEEGELGWVSKEEDWGVVEDPIPVALFSVEFEGKPSRVSCSVRGSLLAADGREPTDKLGFLTNAVKHVCGCL